MDNKNGAVVLHGVGASLLFKSTDNFCVYKHTKYICAYFLKSSFLVLMLYFYFFVLIKIISIVKFSING